jgi:hypothetical protein
MDSILGNMGPPPPKRESGTNLPEIRPTNLNDAARGRFRRSTGASVGWGDLPPFAGAPELCSVRACGSPQIAATPLRGEHDCLAEMGLGFVRPACAGEVMVGAMGCGETTGATAGGPAGSGGTPALGACGYGRSGPLAPGDSLIRVQCRSADGTCAKTGASASFAS